MREETERETVLYSKQFNKLFHRESYGGTQRKLTAIWAFCPIVLSKVAPLSQHVVCRLYGRPSQQQLGFLLGIGMRKSKTAVVVSLKILKSQ